MISHQELDKVEMDDEQRTELFDILVTKGDYVKVLDDDGKPYIARIEETNELKEQPDGTETQAYQVAYLNSKKVVQKTLYTVGVEQIVDLYADHKTNSAYNDGDLVFMAYQTAYTNQSVFIVSGKHNKKSMNRRLPTGISPDDWQYNIALPIDSVTKEGNFEITIGRSTAIVDPKDCLILYDADKGEKMLDIGFLNKVLTELEINWYQPPMVVLDGKEEEFTQYKFRSESGKITASTTYLDLSGKEIPHDKSDDGDETQLDKVQTRATKRNNVLRNQIEEQKKDSAEYSEEEEKEEVPAKRGGSTAKKKGKQLNDEESSEEEEEEEAPTKRGGSTKRKGKHLEGQEEESEEEKTPAKKSKLDTMYELGSSLINSVCGSNKNANREKEVGRFKKAKKQEHCELLTKHGHDTNKLFKKMHREEVHAIKNSEEYKNKLAHIKKNNSIIEDFEEDLDRHEEKEHYKKVNSYMEKEIERLNKENEGVINQFKQKDKALNKKYTELVNGMLVELRVQNAYGRKPKVVVDEWEQYIVQDHVAKID